MSDVSLCKLTLAELGKKIAAKKVSPVEVTAAHLDRIESLNPKLNAFITVAHERARAEARDAEAEILAGQYRGSLHGIPIGVKDIVDTKDVLTTRGASFFRDNVPTQDAECVGRMVDAGAIIIGKCNTGEFAAESGTNNPHYGACRNPWDTLRVPSGSSGGSSAAVAAEMVPGAIGSDTGGSIRGPAAICGTTGLMPTYGRVSVRGVFPHASSLDHVGPLTRTVRDCALLLQGIAGYDPQDPFSVDMPVPDFSAELDKGIKGARLALCPDLIGVEIDQPIADAFEAALGVLRDLGAVINTISVPFATELNEQRRAIADREFFCVHEERWAATREGYSELLQNRIANAGKTTLRMYNAAQTRRMAMKREMIALLGPFDALLLPGYPCLAAPIDTMQATVNGKEIAFNGLGRNLLGMQNFFGFPCLSIPTGFDPAHGLPMSMQITSLPGEEARALGIGAAYEKATPEFRERRPELSQ
jgi:aspartyl-tRNA(Asn)/glutamyl-tRNA(Gln) amidotransferase subunit A